MKTNIFSSVILPFAFTFIFAQHGYAKTFHEPEKCPSESAIASVGIESVSNIAGTWAASVAANNYDTNDTWSFTVVGITASDEEDARGKAMESLQSLQYMIGPTPVPVVDAWGCVYQTDQGYNAMSVTPPLGLRASLRLVK
jgi:hypothetical protein